MYFITIKYVFCFNYLLRSCTEAQTIFKEISSKVTQKAIDGAIKIITRTYPYCVPQDAWDVSNSISFNSCTMEVASSDPQIFAAINNIEKIAQHNVTNNIEERNNLYVLNKKFGKNRSRK